MPAMPQSAAGPRIDPPVSDPVPPRMSPGRDRRAGARGRSRREVLAVPGIARRRPGQVERRSAKGELVGGELAQHHRARLRPLGDGMRVARRHVVLQELGMRRRADARGVVDVLVGDRDAVELAARRARHLPRLRGLGVGQRALLRHHQERIELRIEAADAVEMGLGELDRRQLLRGDELCGFGDGQDRHHFCSTSKVSAGSASRGSGAFTRAISALEDLGARQDSLDLVRRQGEPGPLQHGVEFGFVDRGRHGHSFRLPEGAR